MSEPTAPIRRFYKEAVVSHAEAGGHAVLLDARTLRTPMKAPLVLPTEALAAAIVAEWAGQGEVVRPETMPLTRLANVALDRTPEARGDIAAMIRGYGETDLLCHRADRPEGLVARQASAWDPPLAWAAQSLGVTLVPVAGVMATEQHPASLDRIAAAALALDDFSLTGLAHAVGVTGSAVLGLALACEAEFRGEALFAAAALDELWGQEVWGEDAELTTRLERLKGELAALEEWFLALGAERVRMQIPD
jgi:chaperone required for assembly of F1-ATPase